MKNYSRHENAPDYAFSVPFLTELYNLFFLQRGAILPGRTSHHRTPFDKIMFCYHVNDEEGI